MKVDIYKLIEEEGVLLVPSGKNIEQISYSGGVVEHACEKNIEIPNQSGGLLGINGEEVNRDIAQSGYAIQRISFC